MLCKSCFLISFRKQFLLFCTQNFITLPIFNSLFIVFTICIIISAKNLTHCPGCTVAIIPKASRTRTLILPQNLFNLDENKWTVTSKETQRCWSACQAIKPQSFVLCEVQAFVKLFTEFSEEQYGCCEDFLWWPLRKHWGRQRNNLCTQQKSDVSTVIGWSWLLTEEVTDTKQLQVMKGPQKTKSSNLGFTQ